MGSSWLRVVIALVFVSISGFSKADEVLNSANTGWMMTATALVLLMTLPGVALFYGGLVRSKNVLSVVMQCFSITCIASIVWFAVGYSMAFDTGGAFIGGFSKVFLSGISADSLKGDLPESVFVMFQMTFAIITPALIIGGFAERMKFSAVVIFITIWLLAVYVPITHWVWGGGWLAERGMLDFAGGTVVHITAGVAALVSALVLGKRKGFGETALPPHNMTMTLTGAAMLWVGWFGFNGGSALAANGDAGMAMLVTHLCASTGALTWLGLEWIKYGKPSALGAVTGLVAGLGAITPASGYVGPAAALIIGFSAGIVCFYATLLIKQTWKIDDSLDVFPVHGVGGMLGTLLAGIFASAELGVFSGKGLAEGVTIIQQLGVQLTGIAAVFSYTAVVTLIILVVVRALVGLRVSEDEERQGLDVASHNERGYDL